MKLLLTHSVPSRCLVDLTTTTGVWLPQSTAAGSAVMMMHLYSPSSMLPDSGSSSRSAAAGGNASCQHNIGASAAAISSNLHRSSLLARFAVGGARGSSAATSLQHPMVFQLGGSAATRRLLERTASTAAAAISPTSCVHQHQRRRPDDAEHSLRLEVPPVVDVPLLLPPHHLPTYPSSASRDVVYDPRRSNSSNTAVTPDVVTPADAPSDTVTRGGGYGCDPESSSSSSAAAQPGHRDANDTEVPERSANYPCWDVPAEVMERLLNVLFKRADGRKIKANDCPSGILLSPVTFAFVWPSMEQFGPEYPDCFITSTVYIDHHLELSATSFRIHGLPPRPPSDMVDISKGVIAWSVSGDAAAGHLKICLVCSMKPAEVEEEDRLVSLSYSDYVYAYTFKPRRDDYDSI